MKLFRRNASSRSSAIRYGIGLGLLLFFIVAPAALSHAGPAAETLRLRPAGDEIAVSADDSTTPDDGRGEIRHRRTSSRSFIQFKFRLRSVSPPWMAEAAELSGRLTPIPEPVRVAGFGFPPGVITFQKASTDSTPVRAGPAAGASDALRS